MEEKDKPTEQTEGATKLENKKEIFQIMPLVDEVSKQLDTKTQKALIINSMFVPFSQLQASHESLMELSQNELEQNFKKYLIDPPNIEKVADFENYIIDKSFDHDEDFILLNYIKASQADQNTDFNEFIKEWLYIFKPFRSIKSLESRVEEIKNWSNEELEQFYDYYSSMILNEKLFADSIHESCEQPNLYTHSRCSYEPTEKIAPIEAIDNQISVLSHNVKLFMKDSRYANCLAVLHSEKYEFRMQNEAIMIGRGSPDQIVDVEMNFVSEKPCIHVSRNQAIISFLEDCNFYIENCGNRAFRVNGILIPVGAIAILPPNSILDFSDALLMFIPNLKLVEEVKEAMTKAPQSSSKSKKKSENA